MALDDVSSACMKHRAVDDLSRLGTYGADRISFDDDRPLVVFSGGTGDASEDKSYHVLYQDDARGNVVPGVPRSTLRTILVVDHV